MSCFSHGDQAEEAYSSCGLIRVLYICYFTDGGAFLIFRRIILRVELALAVTSSICLDHQMLSTIPFITALHMQLGIEAVSIYIALAR